LAPSTGDTEVTIAGSDFADVSAVSFGGNSAASYNVDSEARIVAKSPLAGLGRRHGNHRGGEERDRLGRRLHLHRSSGGNDGSGSSDGRAGGLRCAETEEQEAEGRQAGAGKEALPHRQSDPQTPRPSAAQGKDHQAASETRRDPSRWGQGACVAARQEKKRSGKKLARSG
jgi:hypothetical protein